jgi:hypothetical protein
MDRKVGRRANVKFCVKLGKLVTETWNMLRQAYGDEAMSRTQCFEWHRRFKVGRTSLEDDERQGDQNLYTKLKNQITFLTCWNVCILGHEYQTEVKAA